MSLTQRIARVVELSAKGLTREQITYNVGCSSYFVFVALRMKSKGGAA